MIRCGLVPTLVAAGGCDPVTCKEGKAVVVPRYTALHALCHFFASWCIIRREAGGLERPAKIVRACGGHSTLAMTMDTYGQLFPDERLPSWCTSRPK